MRRTNLSDLITRVNRIRRENPALRSNHRLQFHPVNNDYLLAYTKSTEDGTDTILTVVNLDPHHTQSGWIELPLANFFPTRPNLSNARSADRCALPLEGRAQLCGVESAEFARPHFPPATA